MATIFHLALASDWAEAQAAGTYTISTLGRTLAEEGFIHASRGDQWPAVRQRFYAGVSEPLVLLQIDTDLLGVPVVEEAPAAGVAETFPHIYGPLPVAAVVKAIPLDSPAASDPAPAATVPSAPAATAPATPRPTPANFTQAYFREMFRNALLLVVVIVFGLIGAGLGRTLAEGATGVGGFVGLAVGVVLAVVLYRRRS